MAEDVRSTLMKNLNRICVKVGSSSLTQPSGELDPFCISKVVSDIVKVINSGVEVVLVSSGAVAAGTGRLGLKDKPGTMPEKQAAAAVGQGILLHTYEQLFSQYGKVVGQVLLTRGDFTMRKRYLNARNTLSALLKFGAVPIINENDTVAVDEIRVGDNDRLSALAACLVDCDLLVILSDIDGVYSRDPRTDSEAKLIPVIKDLEGRSDLFEASTGSKFGTGGMRSKFHAARIVTSSGIPMVVANASEPSVLQRIVMGEKIGTLFLPGTHKLHTKKRWIGFGSDPEGKVIVDAGAETAVVKGGKSLLASGVVSVEGAFEAGSVVSVMGGGNREIARGIVSYSSAEIEKIKGKHSEEIESILGYKRFAAVIHRDNLTVIV
mgnify:CR=1 FL=1